MVLPDVLPEARAVLDDVVKVMQGWILGKIYILQNLILC